jgi:hypothetical protein
VGKIKRYWVRNDDLKDKRGRDNPREVVLVGDYAELEALFALQRTRMAEAIRTWQEETGKRDVLPDLGDLLAWLMARSVELEALVRKLRDALTCADRDLAETAVTTGYRMRDDTAQKMTDAFARADKALAGAPHANVLKTVSSEWEHTENLGEVPCHSRMIEGVLCRWWGRDTPPGVAMIDHAIDYPEKPQEVKPC